MILQVNFFVQLNRFLARLPVELVNIDGLKFNSICPALYCRINRFYRKVPALIEIRPYLSDDEGLISANLKTTRQAD